VNTNIRLVLAYRWYDETISGEKRIEYRTMKSERWISQIWDRRHTIKTVTFSRGYTSTIKTYRVTKIDIGPCPIPGWDGDYFRIHFEDQVNSEPGTPNT
jgi:hypothetical protein